MCGIGGVLRTDGKRIPATWIKAIDARIAYRGPDGEGTFRDLVKDDDGNCVAAIVLVHRRLSIIDHAGGAQPMVSKRGRSEEEGLVAVISNGCIYNHRALRSELEAAGHEFVSDHSDTEVLIHGYREWGPQLTDHLEGMYALAIWDRARCSLVLARDWFGEKPLYVRHGIGANERILAFSSDARSLAHLTKARLPETDDGFVREWGDRYLQLGYNHGGATVYGSAEGDAIVSVPPAVSDTIDILLPEHADRPLDVDAVETLLDSAVAGCLEADVELGCFLSGGVDSSLVALMAKRHRDDLRTFTVRMSDRRYDESGYASAVAKAIGTRHTTLNVAPKPVEDLQFLVRTLGQPFGDSSILPMYWISRAAREHVKVALSGDGGDELFLGYERYLAARHLARFHWLMQLLPPSLLTETHPRSLRHKLGRLGDMARDYSDRGIIATESLFTGAQIAELTGRAPRSPARVPAGTDALRTLRRADLLEYLPNDLLVKVDTASMATGLEVRTPLLNRDLVRAALAASTKHLLPRGRRKGLLRAVARRHLPGALVDRAKMGFSIPIGEWFRNDYGSMRTMLLDQLLRSRDPFGPVPLKRRAVKRMVDEHLARERDHGQRLFALLTLSMWARMA
ncbi:MAG: asparagine synthase (glutamine-hydrolyzing) [Planctomycetes bacterium]|nr:asparagine synthase (glutamine-hydrolyzing) [Planctomycetota bacterium]